MVDNMQTQWQSHYRIVFSHLNNGDTPIRRVYIVCVFMTKINMPQ